MKTIAYLLYNYSCNQSFLKIPLFQIILIATIKQDENLEEENLMEKLKLPIIIKKRNGLMISIAIIEIIMGIIFGVAGGGLKSIVLWIFVFIGAVTALTVLVEYNQEMHLKEDNLEFYKNNDLIKAIKDSNIKSIYIDKGNEPKTKKKDFFAIGYRNSNTKKDSKDEVFLIDLMSYSSQDLITIKNVIQMKNSAVKLSEDLDKFIK